MCSIPLTVVVNARSVTVTMRPSISVGDKPLYDQMTVTTGMLMDGKMSTGIVEMKGAERKRGSTESKINVWGRRRARRPTNKQPPAADQATRLPSRDDYAIQRLLWQLKSSSYGFLKLSILREV